jgi:hypothetical protein
LEVVEQHKQMLLLLEILEIQVLFQELEYQQLPLQVVAEVLDKMEQLAPEVLEVEEVLEVGQAQEVAEQLTKVLLEEAGQIVHLFFMQGVAEVLL